MARTDTLNNFLTDVADSIRAKKGTTNKIPASNFDTEIESIETSENLSDELNTYNSELTNQSNKLINITNALHNKGTSGGGESINYEVNNVNFLDYDGTVLYSYPLDVIKTMTSLPELPTNNKYTAKMWNWTLEEIIERNEPVDVGVIYQYDDDLVAILKLNISEYLVNKKFYINFFRTMTGFKPSLSVNWGDGSDEILYTFSSNTEQYIALDHIYSNKGKYIVTVKLISDKTDLVLIPPFMSSSGSYYHSLFVANKTVGGFNSSTYPNSMPWWCSVEEVILGVKSKMSAYSLCQGFKSLKTFATDDITFNMMKYGFSNNFNLESIIIPRNVYTSTSSSNYPPSIIFSGCYNLRSIAFPKNIPEMSIGNNMFYNNHSIKKIILPEGITTIGTYFVTSCINLEYAYIPDTVTSIGEKAFSSCHNLKKVRLSNNITSIPNYCFADCFNLEEVNLPNSITSIGTYAFYSQSGDGTGIGINTFDFSKFTQIPSVTKTSFKAQEGLKIIVPDELYDDWIATSNWSTYTNYIIKASEFKGGLV